MESLLKSRRDFKFVDGPGVDDNDRPEAVLFPPIAAGAEVELVASRLGLVTGVSDAAVSPQCLERHAAAAADPLSEGEVRAVAVACEVGCDQDALKPYVEEVKCTIC